MITIDMSKKNVGVRVNDRMFSIDNGILTLQITVMDGAAAYDLTDKTITAIFDKTGYETQPLTPVDGVINIPITNDMIEVGENIFRLNFRWSTSSFEQSPSMTWFIMAGVGGKITFESVNIVGYLISELNQLKNYASTAEAGAETATEQAGIATEQAGISTDKANEVKDLITKTPYVGANGHWYEWDIATSQYADTGVAAKGDKGDTFTYVDLTPENKADLVSNAASAWDPEFEAKYAELETEYASDLTEVKTGLAQKATKPTTYIYAKNYGIIPNSGVPENTRINAMISENWGISSPSFVFEEGDYILTGTITFGLHHQIKPNGKIAFRDNTTDLAIKIKHNDTDSILSEPFLRNFIDSSIGYVVVLNANAGANKTAIDIFASKTNGAGRSNIRLSGIGINGYNIAIQMRPYNSYIWYLDNCQIFNNHIGLQIGTDTNRSNAGEKCTVSNCIFSGNDASIVFRCGGYELRALNTSFDFEGLVVYDYMNNQIWLNDCHIEGCGTRRSFDTYKGIYMSSQLTANVYTLTKLFINNTVLFLEDMGVIEAPNVTFVNGKNTCVHLTDICIHNMDYSLLKYGDKTNNFYLVGDVYLCSYENIEWTYNSCGQMISKKSSPLYPNFIASDVQSFPNSSWAGIVLSKWTFASVYDCAIKEVALVDEVYAIGIKPNTGVTNGIFKLIAKGKFPINGKYISGALRVKNYPNYSLNAYLLVRFYDSSDVQISTSTIATAARSDVDGLGQLTNCMGTTVWIPNMYNTIIAIPPNAYYYKLEFTISGLVGDQTPNEIYITDINAFVW